MQDERCGRGIKIITSGGFALRSRHILDLKNKNRKMAVAEKTVPVFYVPKRKTLLKEL